MPGNPYYKSAHWRALRAACIQRDGGRCTVRGCSARGSVADHIETRPDVAYPTPQDVLENLRTLCASHDSQVKEQRRGKATRRQQGTFKVRGCDEDGWPLDPA
ncbi:MAG TPA: hypothetical protein VFB54_07245, partial [Burkholderiales bacterium]|nr:hypothetical protein [Burkholderiales bacterium]